MIKRGRPRAFHRGEALERALAVFWSKGYEGTSLDDLQTAMGVSRPSLYSAFGDKSALFKEVVTHYLSTSGSIVATAMRDEPTGFSAVKRMLEQSAELFTEAEERRGCLVVLSAINCTPNCVEQEQEMSRIRRSTTQLIRDRIERAAVDGELNSKANVDELTQFYAAVLTGLSIQAKDGSSRAQLLAVVKMAMMRWPEVPAAV